MPSCMHSILLFVDSHAHVTSYMRDNLVTHTWRHICVAYCYFCIGRLWLVGSLKSQVLLAQEPYKRGYILQKRPIILKRPRIVATPYLWKHSFVSVSLFFDMPKGDDVCDMIACIHVVACIRCKDDLFTSNHCMYTCRLCNDIHVVFAS